MNLLHWLWLLPSLLLGVLFLVAGKTAKDRLVGLVVLAGLLGLFLTGCVRMREETYYNPAPRRHDCPIPVCDGPCKEGRVVECTSPSTLRGQRPPLTPGRP